MRAFSLVLLGLMLSSCTSFHSFVQSLNDRQLQSCIYYTGTLQAGAVPASGSLYVRALSVTGGATIDQCATFQRDF